MSYPSERSFSDTSHYPTSHPPLLLPVWLYLIPCTFRPHSCRWRPSVKPKMTTSCGMSCFGHHLSKKGSCSGNHQISEIIRILWQFGVFPPKTDINSGKAPNSHKFGHPSAGQPRKWLHPPSRFRTHCWKVQSMRRSKTVWWLMPYSCQLVFTQLLWGIYLLQWKCPSRAPRWL